MYGAIIGDLVGSVYEHHPTKDYNFSPFFHARSHFTDDTISTIALAECLLDHGDPAEYLRRWCMQYSTSRYGARFQYWMRNTEAGPYQSFGNGSAMRVSSAAMVGRSLEGALELADQLTIITHDHPEGFKGARATTESIWLFLAGETSGHIREVVQSKYGYELARTVADIRPDYLPSLTCQHTVPEAIICALEASSFEEAIRSAVSLGGDADMRPNQVWVADITYIRLARGWCYLVAIIDWHSRYVLAWRLSATMESGFCVAALEEALTQGTPEIHNTDQGTQFTSEAFTSVLGKAGVAISMDGKGSYQDNIFTERLWRSVKYEEVYTKEYLTIEQAQTALTAYVSFYNHERPHQALDYQTPSQVHFALAWQPPVDMMDNTALRCVLPTYPQAQQPQPSVVM